MSSSQDLIEDDNKRSSGWWGNDSYKRHGNESSDNKRYSGESKDEKPWDIRHRSFVQAYDVQREDVKNVEPRPSIDEDEDDVEMDIVDEDDELHVKPPSVIPDLSRKISAVDEILGRESPSVQRQTSNLFAGDLAPLARRNSASSDKVDFASPRPSGSLKLGWGKGLRRIPKPSAAVDDGKADDSDVKLGQGLKTKKDEEISDMNGELEEPVVSEKEGKLDIEATENVEKEQFEKGQFDKEQFEKDQFDKERFDKEHFEDPEVSDVSEDMNTLGKKEETKLSDDDEELKVNKKKKKKKKKEKKRKRDKHVKENELEESDAQMEEEESKKRKKDTEDKIMLIHVPVKEVETVIEKTEPPPPPPAKKIVVVAKPVLVAKPAAPIKPRGPGRPKKRVNKPVEETKISEEEDIEEIEAVSVVQPPKKAVVVLPSEEQVVQALHSVNKEIDSVRHALVQLLASKRMDTTTSTSGSDDAATRQIINENQGKAKMVAEALTPLNFDFATLELDRSEKDAVKLMLIKHFNSLHENRLNQLPLYSSPKDAPCWGRNVANFNKLHDKVKARIAVEVYGANQHCQKLVEQYQHIQSEYHNKLVKPVMKDEAKKSAIAASRSILAQSHPQVDDLDNETKRNRITSSNRSERYPSRTAVGDFVGSEWELKQRLTDLVEAEKKQINLQQNAAVIPDMILSQKARDLAKFDSRNSSRLTTDGSPALCHGQPLLVKCERLAAERMEELSQPSVIGCNCAKAVQVAHGLVNPWSDVEKCIFIDKFTQYPKDFHKISTFLRNKSTRDCISFYYDTKKCGLMDFKELLRDQYTARKIDKKPHYLHKSYLGVSLPKTMIEQASNDATEMSPPPLSESDSVKKVKGKKKLGKEDDDDDIVEVDQPAIGGVLHDAAYSKLDISGVSVYDVVAEENDPLTSTSSAGKQVLTKWTDTEKEQFIHFLHIHGKDWKMIANSIRTKNQNQVKNYYQNYKNRLGLQKIVDDHQNQGGGGLQRSPSQASASSPSSFHQAQLEEQFQRQMQELLLHAHHAKETGDAAKLQHLQERMSDINRQPLTPSQRNMLNQAAMYLSHLMEDPVVAKEASTKSQQLQAEHIQLNRVSQILTENFQNVWNDHEKIRKATQDDPSISNIRTLIESFKTLQKVQTEHHKTQTKLLHNVQAQQLDQLETTTGDARQISDLVTAHRGNILKLSDIQFQEQQAFLQQRKELEIHLLEVESRADAANLPEVESNSKLNAQELNALHQLKMNDQISDDDLRQLFLNGRLTPLQYKNLLDVHTKAAPKLSVIELEQLHLLAQTNPDLFRQYFTRLNPIQVNQLEQLSHQILYNQQKANMRPKGEATPPDTTAPVPPEVIEKLKHNRALLVQISTNSQLMQQIEKYPQSLTTIVDMLERAQNQEPEDAIIQQLALLIGRGDVTMANLQQMLIAGQINPKQFQQATLLLQLSEQQPPQPIPVNPESIRKMQGLLAAGHVTQDQMTEIIKRLKSGALSATDFDTIAGQLEDHHKQQQQGTQVRYSNQQLEALLSQKVNSEGLHMLQYLHANGHIDTSSITDLVTHVDRKLISRIEFDTLVTGLAEHAGLFNSSTSQQQPPPPPPQSNLTPQQIDAMLTGQQLLYLQQQEAKKK